jgi:hypothetical protein
VYTDTLISDNAQRHARKLGLMENVDNPDISSYVKDDWDITVNGDI